jgi:hypothetical protein
MCAMNGGTVVGLVAVLAVALVGCGSGSQEAAPSATSAPSGTTVSTSAESSPTAAPPTSETGQSSGALFLVGQQTATGAAAALLGGFETRINATPGATDTVLFTVSAEDGPMPQTREQIEALSGRNLGPAAILLVRTDRVTDPELRALVIQETRDLLRRSTIARASELPVLLAEDPNIALLIRGLRSTG